MGRAPCCDKTKVKRGPWSPEEDALLKNYISKNGTGGNWISLPQRAELNRCGKSCRLRWLNYLRPDIKHGGFTEQEDYIICTLYIAIGSRWSVIASKLPGRTDNDVKNYWNTKLRKKILAGQVAGFTTTTTTTQYQPAVIDDYGPVITSLAQDVQKMENSTPATLNYYYYNNSWVHEEDENYYGPVKETNNNNNHNMMSWEPVHQLPLLSYQHDNNNNTQSGSSSASGQLSAPITRASSSSSSSVDEFGGCSSKSFLEGSTITDHDQYFWTRLLQSNQHHHGGVGEGSQQQLEQKIHEFASVLDEY